MDEYIIRDIENLARVLGLTRRDLFYMSKNTNKFYKEIYLKKKNGELRKISAPNAYLKQAQRYLLWQILREYDISKYATGYIKGKNLKDNAMPHVGHKYLLKMDISDFFSSITYSMVISAVFNKKKYPRQIGTMLTSLCCKDDILPQGAPTSPTISNIVMKNFDDVIGEWCDKRGISYTRYCDDMTFSSNKPLNYVALKVQGMLLERGFIVNNKKTRFFTNATRQVVTGICVNDKVSVPANYKRELRQELYYVLKYGPTDAIIHGKRKRFIESGKAKTESYYHYLKGKINYLLQIEPNNNWFIEKEIELDDKMFWLSRKST